MIGRGPGGDSSLPSAAAPRWGCSACSARAIPVTTHRWRRYSPTCANPTRCRRGRVCGGAERVRSAMASMPRRCSGTRIRRADNRSQAAFLKLVGKGIDAFRIASWVRRHDAVIVAAFPRDDAAAAAVGLPYSLFVLATSGRLFGTEVALVSVGADPSTSERPGGCRTRPHDSLPTGLTGTRTHAMSCGSAALTRRPIGSSLISSSVSHPPYEPGDPQLVGVGVMAYYGGTMTVSRRNRSIPATSRR